MGNAYLDKQRKRDQEFFMAGMNTGMQIASDYLQIALRDPEAMGKDTFGRKRIEKILQKCMELDDHFSVAFSGDVDADHAQEEMDALLREIYGDDLVPFKERYPNVKQFGYQKPKKGWV